MKDMDSKSGIVADEKKRQYAINENEIRVLFVDSCPKIFQQLRRFVERSSLGVHLEAKSVSQVFEAVGAEHVDILIIDVSLGNTNNLQLVEEIKLQYPTLPVVMLSTDAESSDTDDFFQADRRQFNVNRQAPKQIIKAVRFVRSLLKSHINGFSLLVKI